MLLPFDDLDQFRLKQIVDRVTRIVHAWAADVTNNIGGKILLDSRARDSRDRYL